MVVPVFPCVCTGIFFVNILEGISFVGIECVAGEVGGIEKEIVRAAGVIHSRDVLAAANDLLNIAEEVFFASFKVSAVVLHETALVLFGIDA